MIFLFTLSYPFTLGKEESFLREEVNQISLSFDHFIIIPSLMSSEKYLLKDNIRYNLKLSEFLKTKQLRYKFLMTYPFYDLIINEFIINPKAFIHIKKIKKLIKYIFNTLIVIEWLKKDLDPIINKVEKTVFYSYWFTHLTTALCYYYKKSMQTQIITRAHGIDLFEFRHDDYIPLRRYTLKRLTKFYFVSDYAKNYTSKLYPEFRYKYKTYPLGVLQHGMKNILKKTNEYHFVSCSNIDKNKNVSLILRSIKLTAVKHSNISFTWTHFGTGELLEKLIKETNEGSYPNLKVRLMGYKTSESIYEFYKNESINAFIITSLSEGGRPLSIQEALSFGIPVIATNVGGISELINETNGHLLKSIPTEEEVSIVIDSIIQNSSKWIKKRSSALKTSIDMCNGEKLTQYFIQELKKL